MSDDKKRVMIVDDSHEDIHFIMESLKKDYAVQVATSGEKAIEIVSGDQAPDVILLDVEMPGMDGYEVCRQIKSLPDVANIPIIFVSANDTVEQKLAGYDAGAGDYLVKPVFPDELLKKVGVAIGYRDTLNEIENEKKMAFEAAMTAMSSTGELGVVLEFLRKSFTLTKPEDVAQSLIESMQSYSLKCNIQVRTSNNTFHVSSQGSVSPLAQELLSRLKDKGRIISHGARLILNFGDVSMLVNNMPLDDPDLCGRIRDNVAILLEGAEAKLHELDIENNERIRKQKLQSLVENLNEALCGIEQMQQMVKSSSVKIIDKLLQDLEESFFQMGLTEEQEEVLLNLTRNGVEQALKNQGVGAEADEQLHKIVENLQRYCA